MNNEKLIEFLTELTKLTDKYGFEIGGCGCCGSPWIESGGRDAGVELTYDEEKRCYRVDLDSNRGYHEPIYVYGDKTEKPMYKFVEKLVDLKKEHYDDTLCECWLTDYDNHHHYCNGTKEREICHCNGDVKKCDFYPEKRGEQK